MEKINEKILDIINRPVHRVQIALRMGVGEQMVTKYIKKNDIRLTQASALNYIKEVATANGIPPKEVLKTCQPA